MTREPTKHLTAMQRKVVEWGDNPLLVLAGPDSGGAQMLAYRITQLLDNSPSGYFRILGLTLTNKAAHQMRTRISSLPSRARDRVYINTFHGFCTKILRQHGSHCNVKLSFELYPHAADREAVLADALGYRTNGYSGIDTGRLLSYIDMLKGSLVGPEQAVSHLQNNTHLEPDGIDCIGHAYQVYEEELNRVNALDLNSLIYLTSKLFDYEAFINFYQTVYRYWFIDELHDISDSQYKMLRKMASGGFHRIFAVADDDQITYEWNGANVNRIQNFVDDFGCEVIQLTDNVHCPESIVEAANRLVVYNVHRDQSKPVTRHSQDEDGVECRTFADDQEEALYIAVEIAGLNEKEREKTVVLTRIRALLKPIRAELKNLNVTGILLGRRDDFVSPHMRWLVACLKQIKYPPDQRNMAKLITTFGSYANVAVSIEDVISCSETNQITLLDAWLHIVQETMTPASPVVEEIAHLASGNTRWSNAVAKILKKFENETANGELKDDLSAWKQIEREIKQARGTVPLETFLQDMALRSKEPNPEPGAVSLSTVHGAKGLEFDRVYLIGLAEEIFPSWHSVSKGNRSTAMEEERRSFFVAITRTKKRLILSSAERYNGHRKKPSRFLDEIGTVYTDYCEAPEEQNMRTEHHEDRLTPDQRLHVPQHT